MCLRSLVPSEETQELDPSFSKRGVLLFLNSFSLNLSKSSTIFMFSVGFGGSCFQKDILNLVYIRFHNSSSPTHMKSFGLFVKSFSVTLKFSLVSHAICFNFALLPLFSFFISNFQTQRVSKPARGGRILVTSCFLQQLPKVAWLSLP